MYPLFWLGALIALGAALAFAVVGLLTIYGGVRATREQLLPGFRPDRSGPLHRTLTIVAVWLPAAVVAFFGLYAGAHIVQVVLGL